MTVIIFTHTELNNGRLSYNKPFYQRLEGEKGAYKERSTSHQTKWEIIHSRNVTTAEANTPPSAGLRVMLSHDVLLSYCLSEACWHYGTFMAAPCCVTKWKFPTSCLTRLLFDLQTCGSFTSRPFTSRITSCHQRAIFFSLRHKLYINSMRAAVEPWASVAGSLSQNWDLWPFCWLGLFQTKPGEGHTLTRIYPSGRPITTQLPVQTDMVLHTHRHKHLTKVAYSTLISIDSLF